AVRAVFLFADDHLTLEVIEPPTGDAAAPQPGPEPLETIVVGARRVDALVDLTAEMSIAASKLEQLRARGIPPSDPRMAAACHEVERLAGRLQEAAMKMRLVPLASTFAALRRFVRDKARDLGKAVNVDIRGAQTEMDKSVVERLRSPLEHL